jgi:hypothetical protein
MPVVEAVVVMVVVASEPMTSMSPVPMAAAVGVSEVCTENEQPHDHDEYAHPLLPCSHDRRLSLRVQILMFLNIIPPTSPELPRQSPVQSAHRLGRVTALVSNAMNEPKWVEGVGMGALVFVEEHPTFIGYASG